MNLNKTIQQDFITAFKAKDSIAKAALSSLKTKITEAEKLKSNQELSDDEIIKVVTSAIKQRKQSIAEFDKGNRSDLSEKEAAEILVLQKYMPEQMSDKEIVAELLKIISEMISGKEAQTIVAMLTEPAMKKITAGRLMGIFNKRFSGKADPQIVKNIINRELEVEN